MFKKTLLLLLHVIHSGVRIIINKPTSSDRGEGIALNHKSTIDVSRREDNFKHFEHLECIIDHIYLCMIIGFLHP